MTKQPVIHFTWKAGPFHYPAYCRPFLQPYHTTERLETVTYQACLRKLTFREVPRPRSVGRPRRLLPMPEAEVRHLLQTQTRQVGCSFQAVYQKLARLERHGLVIAMYLDSSRRNGWIVAANRVLEREQ